MAIDFSPGPQGVGGGYFLVIVVIGLWGSVSGWGHIFRAGLTITGLHFH